ncbi:hypothetical protein X777_13028 [Ooceraea biroi]|uniref:Uncharacterized protein n=1 Tax=Ooceraea biroi TaxID=2015173 RepID=A0A026WXR4_OOCBI|nr:hypothetical protein X777_13028 [Ooceraea biroi]
MAEKLHACLVQYFARLEKLNHKWQELSKNAEIPLMALANQAEQFRSIITNPSTESTENAMHKEMLERFIFNILMRMEDEVRLLLNILTQFNDANQVFLYLYIMAFKTEIQNEKTLRTKFMILELEELPGQLGECQEQNILKG